MSKQHLTDRLSTRSPLSKREAVTPVNMYERPQGDKPTSGQVVKPASGETDVPLTVPGHPSTTPLVDKRISREVGKSTTPQVEKYTTHLRPDTIKLIKWTALDNDCKDYEIVQRALDAYLHGERRD